MKRSLDWLAGLLDGEGCFTQTVVTTTAGNLSYSPLITCTLTDKDIIENIYENFGPTQRSMICHPAAVLKDGCKRKETYSWAIQGISAIELMDKLYPLMCSRRKQRILEVMGNWSKNKFYTLLCKRGHLVYGDNVYIKRTKNSNNAYRICKKCHSEDSKLKYHRDKKIGRK